MTLGDVPERMNNSAVLGALAKVGMVLAPIIVSIGIFIIGYWLDGYGKAMGAFDARLTLNEQLASNLDKRATVQESRAETQAKETDKLSDALVTITQKVQTVSDAVIETKTDVGYLRRAEEQRRGARE